MKEKHVDRYLIFEEERQRALEKSLVVNLSKLIQVKKGYDSVYEIAWVQTFISKFENRQLGKLKKESKKKNKKIRRRNKIPKTLIDKSNHPIKSFYKLKKHGYLLQKLYLH